MVVIPLSLSSSLTAIKYIRFPHFRLSIYYLNATSKGYQAMNLELKKKLQNVRRLKTPDWFSFCSLVSDSIGFNYEIFLFILLSQLSEENKRRNKQKSQQPQDNEEVSVETQNNPKGGQGEERFEISFVPKSLPLFLVLFFRMIPSLSLFSIPDEEKSSLVILRNLVLYMDVLGGCMWSMDYGLLPYPWHLDIEVHLPLIWGKS